MDRDRDEQDRRVVQLKLTDAARAVGERCWAEREGAITAALDAAEPGERELIRNFVETLTRELEHYVCEAMAKSDVPRPGVKPGCRRDATE